MTDSNQLIDRIIAMDRQMIIHWGDHSSNVFPYLFLRDNCDSPVTRHKNGQKLIETHEIPKDIAPLSWNIEGQGSMLSIHWNHGNHNSRFSSGWLADHKLSGEKRTTDNSKIMIQTWDHALQDSLPEKDFLSLERSETELLDWLTAVERLGFGILRNVPAQPNQLLEVIRLFGFVRETNYGKIFDVKTVVDPNNLAYSNTAISPHTDNPYRHPVPTLQLLHCLESSAAGGDSILVDGFKIAELIRKEWPGYFRLLTGAALTYRFRDKDTWLENAAPVIALDLNKKVKSITYNNRSVCAFELDENTIGEYYEAYQHFGKIACDAKFQVTFKMTPGDLYIVNNERILHARTAFDESVGQRWLQGAYADIDSMRSRLRVFRAGLNS
jgi:gamma-butyrobetaine dioxygenase